MVFIYLFLRLFYSITWCIHLFIYFYICFHLSLSPEVNLLSMFHVSKLIPICLFTFDSVHSLSLDLLAHTLVAKMHTPGCMGVCPLFLMMGAHFIFFSLIFFSFFGYYITLYYVITSITHSLEI